MHLSQSLQMGVPVIDRNFWRGALQLADPRIWIGSFVPATIGMALGLKAQATGVGPAELFWMSATYAALALIETGKNGVNEYIDFVTGVDPGVDAAHRTDFSGGKRTLTAGLLTRAQAALTFAAAAGIGLAMVIWQRPALLWLGMAGIGISIMYTLPPFKLCYRGLGEAAVALTFGPLIVSGGYLLFAGRIDILPLLVSLPVGLVVANILLINEFPDYEADLAGGKRNLVVTLGKRRAATLYGLVFAVIYALYLVPAWYTGSLLWLLPWVSAPLAIRAWRNCVRYHDDIPRLIASNSATIQICLLTGLTLTIASVLV